MNMKRERYEARALGWHVVRIDPKGIESTVEVWPEERRSIGRQSWTKGRRKASKLNKNAAQGAGRTNALGTATSSRLTTLLTAPSKGRPYRAAARRVRSIPLLILHAGRDGQFPGTASPAGGEG